jgi:hypothetical protein
VAFVVVESVLGAASAVADNNIMLINTKDIFCFRFICSPSFVVFFILAQLSEGIF